MDVLEWCSLDGCTLMSGNSRTAVRTFLLPLASILCIHPDFHVAYTLQNTLALNLTANQSLGGQRTSLCTGGSKT